MCSAERPWAAGSLQLGATAPRDGLSAPPAMSINARAPQRAHDPVRGELRHLRDIEEQGESAATPLIMAGFVWVGAAVIVVVITAAVYVAVQLGA